MPGLAQLNIVFSNLAEDGCNGIKVMLEEHWLLGSHFMVSNYQLHTEHQANQHHLHSIKVIWQGEYEPFLKGGVVYNNPHLIHTTVRQLISNKP
jgi:hypothetical protein